MPKKKLKPGDRVTVKGVGPGRLTGVLVREPGRCDHDVHMDTPMPITLPSGKVVMTHRFLCFAGDLEALVEDVCADCPET